MTKDIAIGSLLTAVQIAREIPYLRAVGSSPKCIRKKPERQIQKNLNNIMWYSCYESSKTRKCKTLLFPFHVSFITIIIYVLLRYAVQDIFDDYSSNRAKRGAAYHGTVFFRGRP